MGHLLLYSEFINNLLLLNIDHSSDQENLTYLYFPNMITTLHCLFHFKLMTEVRKSLLSVKIYILELKMIHFGIRNLICYISHEEKYFSEEKNDGLQRLFIGSQTSLSKNFNILFSKAKAVYIRKVKNSRLKTLSPVCIFLLKKCGNQFLFGVSRFAMKKRYRCWDEFRTNSANMGEASS